MLGDNDSQIAAYLYKYKVFGLVLASELALPELPPGTGLPQVNICLGKVPEKIDDRRRSGAYNQAGNSLLLLRVKNVAAYYIQNGSRITVEPAANADIRAIRLFLLGSAMGAVLLQRRILPLHASALVSNNHCYIITGSQGAGKSTLAAAMAKRGFSVLTDDIAAITFDQAGTPWVAPSYPQQKLWQDSLAATDNNTSVLAPVYGRLEKYCVALGDSFCSRSKRVAGIYRLRAENCQKVIIRQLYGLDKITAVMNNIYRAGFAADLDLRAEIFRLSTALAQNVFVAAITRPKVISTLEEMAACMETDICKWTSRQECRLDVHK